MLNGVRVYSSDNVWRQILMEFHATVLDAPSVSAIDFDALNLSVPVTPLELKTIILNALDNSDTLRKIFGTNVRLPRLQALIVLALYNTGGMSVAALRSALGYGPDVTTHAVDTAIYQLRKTYGHEFIKNNNGVYSLGGL